MDALCISVEWMRLLCAVIFCFSHEVFRNILREVDFQFLMNLKSFIRVLTNRIPLSLGYCQGEVHGRDEVNAQTI